MKKALLMITALFLAGAVSAFPEVIRQKAWRGAAKNANKTVIAAVPEIKSERMIVSGNKKLSMESDGTITLSNASYVIAKILPYSAYTDKISKKTDWIFVTPKDCKMSRDGSKIVFELDIRVSCGATPAAT